jgi:protein CpxP
MSPQSAPPAQSTSPQDQDASPAARPAPGQNSSTASAPTHTDEENPLGLTDAQKAQLRPIVTEETQQMEAVRNDSSLSQEQKMSKINQIREAASPKIKAILTPEQLQRLAQMQRARQQQDQSNAPQAQPQH